ncbi:MAG: 4Fe-4S dicluster domain-containing protein, partial [Desulfatiglandales bacterium]
VCTAYHYGVLNPMKSRIKVMKWEPEGLYIPVTCNHCQDAPCMSACPVKAIYRDRDLDTVMVDQNACIGCRTCVAVCPFGAMSFNTKDQQVFKCDLCDGDPQCVRFCDIKCIEYVDVQEVAVEKKRDFAGKIRKARKEEEGFMAQM